MKSAPKFIENAPYEKGFAEVFDQLIVTKLQGLERERLKLIRKRRFRLKTTITVAIIFVLAMVLLLIGRPQETNSLADPVAFAVILLLVISVGGYFWIMRLPVEHGETLHGIIVEAVCSFFDNLEYFREPSDRFDRERFTDHNVIPPATWTRFENLFVGKYRDTEFKMVDAEVWESSSQSGGQSLFDGLLIEICAPMAFSGCILINGDSGWIGNLLKGFSNDGLGKVSHIQHDDDEFEQHYVVHASDSSEAMRLITPKFCEYMLTLTDAYNNKSLGAAFVDGVFLLAVPMPGDIFKPYSIERSVYDCESDIHKFLRKITIAYRMIECLQNKRLDNSVMYGRPR